MGNPDLTNTCASSLTRVLLTLQVNTDISVSSQWCGLAAACGICLSLRFPPMEGTFAMSCTPTLTGETSSSPWSPGLT